MINKIKNIFKAKSTKKVPVEGFGIFDRYVDIPDIGDIDKKIDTLSKGVADNTIKIDDNEQGIENLKKNTVDLTSNQTVNGTKTFFNRIRINGFDGKDGYTRVVFNSNDTTMYNKMIYSSSHPITDDNDIPNKKYVDDKTKWNTFTNDVINFRKKDLSISSNTEQLVPFGNINLKENTFYTILYGVNSFTWYNKLHFEPKNNYQGWINLLFNQPRVSGQIYIYPKDGRCFVVNSGGEVIKDVRVVIQEIKLGV